MLRRFPLAIVLALALLLAGCGEEEAFDRRNVNAVYERVMAAVFDADLKTLQDLLTKEARVTLEQDLQRLRRRLGHPVDGKREREVAAVILGGEADAAVKEAAAGPLAEALRFLVRISPRERTPPRKGLKLGKFESTMLYALSNGNLRSVRLVLEPRGWFVDELQL